MDNLATLNENGAMTKFIAAPVAFILAVVALIFTAFS